MADQEPERTPVAVRSAPPRGGDAGRTVTGEDSVDAALAALDALPERPVREHPEVLDAVHQALAAHLAEGPA